MRYKASLHVLLAAGLAQSAPLPPYASLVTRVCHSGGITVDGAVASVICTQPASAIQTMEEDFTLDNRLIRRQGSNSELAASYAALILADDGVEITADKLNTLIAAAKVEDVEPIWTSLFAKALEGKDVKDLLTNIGGGGKLKKRELLEDGMSSIRLEEPSPRVRLVNSNDELGTDSRLLQGATLVNADVFFDPTLLTGGGRQLDSL